MSRSYKKTLGYCDSNPFMKNYANRKIRKSRKNIPNGGAYRKLTCSWNICDYKFIWFSNSELVAYYIMKGYTDEEIKLILSRERRK